MLLTGRRALVSLSLQKKTMLWKECNPQVGNPLSKKKALHPIYLSDFLRFRRFKLPEAWHSD